MMNGYYGGSYGNMMAGGGSWLLIVLGGLFFLLLVIGGIALIIWALSRDKGAAGGMGTGSTADEECLAILKKRYAAGEIDQKQFEQMRKDCDV